MSLAPSCGLEESLHIITRLMRPPPVLVGRPSSFAPLHQLASSVTFQDCPFPCPASASTSTSTAILHVNRALPTLLHPLPTHLPFTALLSPLRQSTVLHFELSARQAQVKANKQPAVSAGNILWGVRPSRQPLQARRRLPRYWNPTELIYPSLCQGHRAHESPRAHASTLIPSSAQRLAEPTAVNRNHRMQRRTAHRRPLASPVD